MYHNETDMTTILVKDGTNIRSKSARSTDDRARNWTFVIYPGDSAPDNYAEIMDNMHLQWAESPLHDKDVNGDGLPKKAHKHIAVCFDGKKSYDQVLTIAQLVNGTVPQRTHNLQSLIRYFAHLDNPEKVQYSITDIVSHGGLDIKNVLAPNSSQRYDIIKEMMQFCVDMDIFEFSDLCMYAMENRFDDWYPVLVDHNTLVMKTYLDSRRYKYRGVQKGDTE